MQENLSQQNKQDQENEVPFQFEMDATSPHSLNVVGISRHHCHPEDIHPEVRSFINRSLEIPLVNVYEMITEKKLDKALFFFYYRVFPEAIKAIIEIESRFMGQKVTDDYTKSLLEEFYRAMDDKQRVVSHYIGKARHYSFHDTGCKCVFNTDGLFLEIIESKMALQSGRVKKDDPSTDPSIKDALFDLNIKYPPSYSFIGTDYRKQIIEHVALFWELFVFYYVTVGKGDDFTIPETEWYYPGKTDKASLDYFDVWVKEPLEKRIESTGLNHFKLLEEDAKLEGGFAEINPDHLDPEDRERYGFN